MKRNYFYCAAASLLLSAPLAHAGSKDINLNDLVIQAGVQAQNQFRLLSEDLGSALSYKAVAPAEPLGLTGFDIGLELSATKMSNATQWKNAVSGGKAIETLPVPKLHVHKGLPFDIDVGVMYTSIPTTNIKLVGGELRYAFIAGDVVLPAVAVRGTLTKLSGVSNLAFGTKGLELAVSKGFLMFTPYASIGQVWTTSDPSACLTPANCLKKEEFQQTKMEVGVNINFGLLNMSIDGDKTGDSTTYSAKLGLRF